MARHRTETEHGVDGDARVAIEAARDRFGGLDFGASLSGMLVAIAMIVILGGLAAAILGTVGYQAGIDMGEQELTVGGGIAGLVVLFLAFLVGGWAAGRMARYNGGLNGLMSAVWMLILTVIFAALGAWINAEYNVFFAADLPNWPANLTGADATTIAVVTGIVAILVTFAGGFLGGVLGARYHRGADATIATVAADRSYVDVTTYEDEHRPLEDWSDEELIDEYRTLRRSDRTVEDRDVELERQGHSLAEVSDELERRGYDLDSLEARKVR